MRDIAGLLPLREGVVALGGTGFSLQEESPRWWSVPPSVGGGLRPGGDCPTVFSVCFFRVSLTVCLAVLDPRILCTF